MIFSSFPERMKLMTPLVVAVDMERIALEVVVYQVNDMEREDDVLKIENKEPPVAFLDSFVLAEWEDRMQRGLFRYDVTAYETKVIPGEYGFIAHLNEGRHLKKRPTEFRVDKRVKVDLESRVGRLPSLPTFQQLKLVICTSFWVTTAWAYSLLSITSTFRLTIWLCPFTSRKLQPRS